MNGIALCGYILPTSICGSCIHWMGRLLPANTQSWICWLHHMSQEYPCPGGCVTNVSRALQKNLAKIYNARNRIYRENFKLKLCTCAQSMPLGTRTGFQLEILIRSTISAIHKFREIILESSRNVSEPTPGTWLNMKGTCFEERISIVGVAETLQHDMVSWLLLMTTRFQASGCITLKAQIILKITLIMQQTKFGFSDNLQYQMLNAFAGMA